MSLIEILDLLNKAGIVVAAIGVLWLGLKGKWVFGRTYKECQKERKQWKRLALTSTKVAEQVLAERKTDGCP